MSYIPKPLMSNSGYAELRDQLRRSCEQDIGTAPANSETVSLLISHLTLGGKDLLIKCGELLTLQRFGKHVSIADLVLVKSHLQALTELVGELERECGGR